MPLAARALGISERAVRKRIATGALRAEPFGRSYRVWLPEAAAPPGPDPPGPEPIEARYTGPPAVSPSAYAQLAAIRDQWLAPLVDRIAEQAEQLGRLEAERDTAEAMVDEQRRRAERAEREREDLRRRAGALEAERDRLLAEAARGGPLGSYGAEDLGDVWDDPRPLWRRVWQALTRPGEG